MSGAKHTPGPWVVHPVRAEVEAVIDGLPVCKLLWPTEERTEDVTLANARLIAAAPLLLDALEMCARFFDKDEWEWGDGTPFDAAKIHAAIRAARGEG